MPGIYVTGMPNYRSTPYACISRIAINTLFYNNELFRNLSVLYFGGNMFSYNRKINFYDCDPAGILFYARVYEICHAAYESLIESFDIGEDYWNSPDYIVPVINSEAFYHRPVKYGEEITIEINVKQLKTTSFELNYLVKNSRGEKCIIAKTVHVFVSKESMKKTNITGKVYKGLEKHLV